MEDVVLRADQPVRGPAKASDGVVPPQKGDDGGLEQKEIKGVSETPPRRLGGKKKGQNRYKTIGNQASPLSKVNNECVSVNLSNPNPNPNAGC
jgi:hypothetical protein